MRAIPLLLFTMVTAWASDPEAVARRRLLDRRLVASNPRERREALLSHGAIRDDELPYLAEMTTSFFQTKRRNAAELLNIGKPDKTGPLSEKVILETTDAYVWAVLAADVIEKKPVLAGRRPEMIRIGLDLLDARTREVSARPREKPRDVPAEDQRLIRTALRAAVVSKAPGIDEVLKRAIRSPEGRVRAIAFNGLSRDSARDLQPVLVAMLATERDVYAFGPLGLALIRTGDEKAWIALDDALKAGEKESGASPRSDFRNHLFVELDPAHEAFLWWAIREKRSFGREALDLLTTEVWTGDRKAEPKLVMLCAEVVESGNRSTDVFRFRTSEVSKEQESCELLIGYLVNGTNPVGDFDHRKRGSDAVAAARQWLAKASSRD